MAEITYEDIKRVNEEIKPIELHGKNYAEVHERIKAFRKLHPNGKISTEIVKMDENSVIMKSTIEDEEGNFLGSGYARETEYSNKISFLEVCETSAVGRALGVCGLGIDVAVATVEGIQSQEEQEAALSAEIGKLTIIALEKREELLKDFDVDVHEPKYNAWILSHKVKSGKYEGISLNTQDPGKLDEKGLNLLILAYKRLYQKINEERINENNDKVVQEQTGGEPF